jgi:hypothetical protein
MCLGQLVHDVSRQSVEKMRVIDPDQDTALALLGDKRTDDTSHIRYRVAYVVAYRCGECAQWELSSGLGADNPICSLA